MTGQAQSGRARTRRVRETRLAWSPTESTPYLLDVNVLIALIDPLHPHHDRAHGFLHGGVVTAWATCPMTENGVIRIVGNPRYPNSPGSPQPVAAIMARLRARPDHEFWPDDISLLDAARVDAKRLIASAMVADSYLLALAVAHGGRLATFDSRLVTDAVTDGRKALHVIS